MGEEYHENLTPKFCIHTRQLVCKVSTKLLSSLSIDISKNAELVKLFM